MVCLLIVRISMMIVLLNEIMIALFNSVSVHISMPFNRLLELFTVLMITRVGYHRGWKAALIKCTEAKANTVKTRAHRFPPSQSLSVIHILLYFCFSTSSSSACT